MKKAFRISTAVALLIFVIGIIVDPVFFAKIEIGIGIFFLLISMLTSGVLVSGPQLRANYHTENKEERRSREKAMFTSSVIMIPHFLIGALLFLI
ncbi:DUF5316 family protein [Virgibacillus kekensis]|uniref:DUF5316 family protein n=1 Tax=Virgibacillus kekensis TaxID=202261 RepID=A0ABV9DJT4_9BACI